MAETIDFKAKSGASAKGAFHAAAGGKGPGLVVVQEWWGVDAHIESLVDRFAAAGFTVLAPDLYEGTVVDHAHADQAFAAMQKLDGQTALDKIGGAIAFLKGHAATNGKVGITGFCMGGAYSIAAAATQEGLSASVPFYGIPDLSKLDLTKIKIPMQGHFAKKDGHVSPDKVEHLAEALKKAGVSFELHMYDADHAFVNDTRPEVHNAGEAKIAVERAIAFLKKHVG